MIRSSVPDIRLSAELYSRLRLYARLKQLSIGEAVEEILSRQLPGFTRGEEAETERPLAAVSTITGR